MRNGPKGFPELARVSKRLILDCAADSLTLFASDPSWPGHLRLIYHHGVKYPEPLYGFLADDIYRLHTQSSEKITFCSDMNAQDAPRRRASQLIHNLTQINNLFGDFVSREGITSHYRALINGGTDTVNGMAFINFNSVVKEDKSTRNAIEVYSKHIANILQSMVYEPRFDAFSVLAAVNPLFNMRCENAASQNSSWWHDVDAQAHSVMEAIIARAKPSCVTPNLEIEIFACNESSIMLMGDNFTSNQYSPYSNNLESWVALRNRSIAITNSNKTRFISLLSRGKNKPENTSIIAVPIAINQDIVGVLKVSWLGSFLQKAGFHVIDIARLLTYACQLTTHLDQFRQAIRQAQIQKDRLVSVYKIASDTKRKPAHKEDLVSYVVAASGADMCAIWTTNLDSEFEVFAITGRSSELRCKPRQNGISRHLIDNGLGIMGVSVTSSGFSLQRWNESSSEWENFVSPIEIQDDLLIHYPAFHLAIVLRENSSALPIGICWLSWDRAEFLTQYQIELAKSATNSVSSLIQIIRNRDNEINSHKRQVIKALRHEGLARLSGTIRSMIMKSETPEEFLANKDNLYELVVTCDEMTICLLKLFEPNQRQISRVDPWVSWDGMLPVSPLVKYVERANRISAYLFPDAMVNIDIPKTMLWPNKAEVEIVAIFHNFIHNARKYSRPPPDDSQTMPREHAIAKVYISAQLISYDDSECIDITIEDNGPGIPDSLASIFGTKALSEVEASQPGITCGSGLGAWISRSMIHSLSGKIVSIEPVNPMLKPNVMGRGLRIHFQLPYRKFTQFSEDLVCLKS